MALLWGLQCAVVKNFLPIRILSDSQNLVEMVKGGAESLFPVGLVVQDIRDLSDNVRQVELDYCSRDINGVAYYLATQRLSSDFNVLGTNVTELCPKDYYYQ